MPRSASRQERPLQMAPKLYASKRCRSDRVTWLAKELDIPLEVVELKDTQFKDPDYLKINPLAQVGGLQHPGRAVPYTCVRMPCHTNLKP